MGEYRLVKRYSGNWYIEELVTRSDDTTFWRDAHGPYGAWSVGHMPDMQMQGFTYEEAKRRLDKTLDIENYVPIIIYLPVPDEEPQ